MTLSSTVLLRLLHLENYLCDLYMFPHAGDAAVREVKEETGIDSSKFRALHLSLQLCMVI